MVTKTKSRIVFFDKIFLFCNYGVAACILISYLAPFTDPAFFWPVALFGLAYPPLLLLNALFVLYWLLRFKKYILISLCSILLGYSILQKNIGFHSTTQDTPKARPEQIRMMAYNVHSFSNAQTNASSAQQIVSLVREQQPDFINMEEFYSFAKGKFAMCDSIKAALQTPYYFYQPFSGTLAAGGGLAIFSKFPIIHQGVIRLTQDYSDTKAIFIDVKKDDKIFRVYCVHLQSFLLTAEDHVYMDSVSQKGKTNIRSSKRIVSKLKAAFIHRSAQVTMMKDHMAQCPYPYIVAGDFNDTPSSYAVNQMSKGIKNAFREKGRGLGRTYNGDIPNYQIDYILVSPQFDVLNYTVIEKKLSDHYPIRSDLLLK
ncbi:endonuclease/exonuclease/phosphatase family protein [Mucilaginibacter paludis]|uniref:Endonuclease/exonuclease/phosphatase n=1 Tax=Mucilaginibacter paludis DSM 18603 TaxID=714943 RepID=H1Y0L6_9SPHI|nr:endonuclease/exonuclease/phosphatase family protein [Mucilaginibacter paludis]EHQ28483.1 Endonuclease/exonuclease/phosphatase [Mucilaginibacter paludis DSM 18603]